MIEHEQSSQPNQEEVINSEQQVMFDTYWNFYKTAKNGEDSTLLAKIEHDDIEHITEDANVRMLLEHAGIVRIDAPSYFELEPTRSLKMPGIDVHNRVIGRSVTADGLDFTVASAVIIHGDCATETIFLKLGSISAEDEEKIKSIEENWERIISLENDRFRNSPFPVDLTAVNALRVAKALNLRGGTVLDLKQSDLES
jgi:hypothetical protein